MAIFGVGVDAVDIPRVERLLKRYDRRFLDRLFTQDEQAYCIRKVHTAQHLAARVAAKEAFVKALGTGFRDGIIWSDIEVAREKGGRPHLKLHGPAKARAERMGIRSMSLALTHTDLLAFAEVILEKP